MKFQRYEHKMVEMRWQETWSNVQLYTLDLQSASKCFYNLMMFPYPSAEGLHVGNMYAFTGSDIYGRYKSMQGYDVFEPIGLDGFGIHSENYSIKVGRHPFEHASITEKNFYHQLHRIGAMFDWNHTIETYKKEYYKWTQWLFIELYKQGLAYRSNAPVNWCPSCKTVLADEQVIDGKCERCGNAVIKKQLTQWFFKITDYAEKLDKNIEFLDWSEKVKIAQKNWIGMKKGINITYPVVTAEDEVVGEIVCFTTRPDTNFGASFVVIAPEHSFISQLTKLLSKENLDPIASYVKSAVKTNEEDRMKQGRTKTGIFTHLYCLNHLTGQKMPLYVSDFVLMNVGTGAVVGVPAHDKRDFEFAQLFHLPVKRVVIGPNEQKGEITTSDQVYEDYGTVVNSVFLNGLNSQEAQAKIIALLEEKKWGKSVTTYHLRDWLISRQRFWGPPIPMIYCEYCAKNGQSWFTTKEGRKKSQHDKSFLHDVAGWYPVEDAHLPVELPYVEDFRPGDDGVAPLQKHKEFYKTTCPACQKEAVRETDVSDTFLDSSWYFLRYPSSDNKRVPFDKTLTQKWLPVSMYTGGAEHSVLHLMYARFVTKALFDMGHISFEEPFSKFFAHGLVIKDGAKMSKSKGNVVNPDEYIEAYGADALRCYLMFMGPYSDGGDFRDTAMEGMYKWINRVYTIAVHVFEQDQQETDEIIEKHLHRLIKKVGEDMERRHYNTSLSSMMEFTNIVTERDNKISIDSLRVFLKLLAPFAPHITEELFQRSFGRETFQVKEDSIHKQEWPTFNPDFLIDSEVEIIVQVNGKVRGKFISSLEESQNKEIVYAKAMELEGVKRFVQSEVKKTILVPGKLLNIVV